MNSLFVDVPRAFVAANDRLSRFGCEGEHAACEARPTLAACEAWLVAGFSVWRVALPEMFKVKLDYAAGARTSEADRYYMGGHGAASGGALSGDVSRYAHARATTAGKASPMAGVISGVRDNVGAVAAVQDFLAAASASAHATGNPIVRGFVQGKLFVATNNSSSTFRLASPRAMHRLLVTLLRAFKFSWGLAYHAIVSAHGGKIVPPTMPWDMITSADLQRSTTLRMIVALIAGAKLCARDNHAAASFGECQVLDATAAGAVVRVRVGDVELRTTSASQERPRWRRTKTPRQDFSSAMTCPRDTAALSLAS